MFKRRAFAVLFLFLLAGGFLAAAEEKPVARVWAKRFDSVGHMDDEPSAIAVDGSGNVFVAGVSRVPSYQTGTNDSLMIKYSGSGEALWTNHFPMVSPVGMATDTNGNVFMTGSAYGETSRGADLATMAFSGAGALLWTNVYSSRSLLGEDTPNGMALDGDGNVYVVGFAEGFPGMHTVIKYANGGLASWTNYFPAGNLAGLKSALCIDVNGDVIATGSSIGTNGYSHYQTVKFTSSGTPLWTNWYYGPGNYADVIAGVASDALGNVYVTGTSWGETDTQQDIATVAYAASGVALWTNRFDGPAHSWDQAARIGVNAKGNVVVTGTAGIQLGAPAYIVMVAYSAAGTPLWTKYYNNGRGEDTVSAIAFDEFGNTLLAGTSLGIGGDFVALKVSNDGKGISTNRFNGTNNDSDWASAIAAGKNGDFFVTGSVRDNDNGVVNWNFATLKYSIVDPLALQIELNGGQAVLSWSNPIFELQSTASLDEPFTDVPGAVSGYTTAVEGVQRYYRLVAP